MNVIDTASAMTAILDAPEDRRVDLLRAMWEPMAAMYRFAPGEIDLAQAHRQSFGFAWDRSLDDTRRAVNTLVQADAWNRADAALRRAVSALQDEDPAVVIPDIKVLLVVGDSGNSHFIDEVQGLSAFGGISGYIAITVWPTPTVIDRLEAIVAHEVHHNVRYSPGGVIWDPATVTVGEQVVSEGLADVFAVELFGDLGYAHFVSDETWTDDAVLAKVASGLEVTGMANFTAWIHGDASARLFGAEPVGLPTGAGYAVGARLVRAFLNATGGTAARNLRTPAARILEVGGERLGISRQRRDGIGLGRSD